MGSPRPARATPRGAPIRSAKSPGTRQATEWIPRPSRGMTVLKGAASVGWTSDGEPEGRSGAQGKVPRSRRAGRVPKPPSALRAGPRLSFRSRFGRPGHADGFLNRRHAPACRGVGCGRPLMRRRNAAGAGFPGIHLSAPGPALRLPFAPVSRGTRAVFGPSPMPPALNRWTSGSPPRRGRWPRGCPRASTRHRAAGRTAARLPPPGRTRG